MKRRGNERLLSQRLGFTAAILALYVLGRAVPLYKVDLEWYRSLSQSAESFLGMAVGGDAYRTSIFALGISPYMIASILIMAATAIRKALSRSKVSIKKVNRILYGLTFVLAAFQAVFLAMGMRFAPSPLPLAALRTIAAASLVAGAMLIVWMLELNKEYGFGGQSLLILVNLISSIFTMLVGSTAAQLLVPVGCSVLAAVVTFIMESAEHRMPVQRIFIHNVYKDKNYIAIKYNPVGVLPVMFATAVFMFFRQIFLFLQFVFPQAKALGVITNYFVLTHPGGITIYVGIVYALTLVFAMVLVGPGEMSDQLLKNNDSICNITSGRPTKRYLTGAIIKISLFSATVMSACLGLSMVLQEKGVIPLSLMMLPSVAMMFSSILVNLYRELKTAISFEAYHTFL